MNFGPEKLDFKVFPLFYDYLRLSERFEANYEQENFPMTPR